MDPRQSAARIDGRAEGPILGGHSVKLSNRADHKVSARLLVALFSMLSSFAIDRRAERAVGCCLRGSQTTPLRLLTTPVRHPPILYHKRCPCLVPPLCRLSACKRTECPLPQRAAARACAAGLIPPTPARRACEAEPYCAGRVMLEALSALAGAQRPLALLGGGVNSSGCAETVTTPAHPIPIRLLRAVARLRADAAGLASQAAFGAVSMSG